MQTTALFRFPIGPNVEHIEPGEWALGSAEPNGMPSHWMPVAWHSDPARFRKMGVSATSWGTGDLATHPANGNAVLFREFADLDGSLESFAGFAREYGFLGISREFYDRSGDEAHHGWGECFEDWAAAHRALNAATRVSDALLNRVDDAGICEAARPWILERTDHSGERHYREVFPLSDLPYLDLKGVRGFTPLTMWVPLDDERGTLAHEIAFFAPGALSQAIGAHLRAFGEVGFGADQREWAGARLHFTATTLIGALWLQLARSVDGHEHKQCLREGCLKYFEVDPQVTRGDRDYCSAACKQKAYRARKAKLAELEGDAE